MSRILEVENLSFSIEQKKIVKDISLSLSSERILAVLGQSGSGKSTLLKLIAGFLDPDKGKLLIEGEPIDPPSEKLIPGHPLIKMVRQDNPLFPNHSLRENIDYELRSYNHEYREERVQKLLKLTRLEKVADQLPRQSSEGEQQRTAIARAIADEPSLLLLDEPFSNLDYQNKKRLKSEVREIVNEEQMACIFVTHDVSDVFGLADEMLIIKDGRIAQHGEPMEIYKQPKSTYEAGLTGEYNLLSQKEAEGLHLSVSKKVIVRPEEIEIISSENGDFEVVNVKEMGFYQDLELKKGKQTLKVFSQKRYSRGDMVKVKIKSYSSLA
ncbi:ABC transporter ATP-binding protein [Jiulongibacter sp. NS-SX5]|uniref:ABC transporter ATP-binding protein n=1 Tax=Jiulongibacter sp. NS-SX5 TaxID=3463854 RepID=UPI004059FF06